jgi:hypothetical protein
MDTSVEDALALGDDSMRGSNWSDARESYRAAYAASRGRAPAERVWILIRVALAALRLGDAEDAFGACAAAQTQFAKTSGVVAGNPLFHLVAGMAADRLGEAAIAEDNLARAMICGGPAIFTHEDPALRTRIESVLLPPAETGTWDGYEGCSRDLLDGARGYLAELLERRLGAPPPYPTT